MSNSNSLGRIIGDEIGHMEKATNRATRDATNRLKNALRLEVAAGLPGAGAARASKAIRSREYDDRGRLTGIVYSTLGRKQAGQFVDYLAIHEAGGTIKPKNGRYLYVPLPGAGRLGKSFRRIIGMDKVRLVPIKGNRFLIVRGTRRRDTIIGLLVPRVRIPKRLNFEAIVNAEMARYAARVVAEMDALA